MPRTASDPFLERIATPYTATLRVINMPVQVESNQHGLLRLAQQAFDDYGATELATVAPLHLRLIANTDFDAEALTQPPPVRVWSDGDLLVASMTSADIGVCSFKARRAMITVSPAMMAFPYHVRYELIEFILYQLVSRSIGAVGIHVACVADPRDAQGGVLLLLGESGAGKSTLAYACLTRGWRFLSEDGAFVVAADTVPVVGGKSRNVKVTIRGMPNFIHLNDGAQPLFPDAYQSQDAIWITRRSGRRKVEIDVRQAFPEAPRNEGMLDSLIFLTQQRGPQPTIRLLPVAQVRARLITLQPFAAAQVNWPEILPYLLAYPAYLLDAGSNPHSAVDLLGSVLPAIKTHFQSRATEPLPS